MNFIFETRINMLLRVVRVTCTLIICFACFPSHSYALGTYGWYQPLGQDSLGPATGCLSNEARVDVALKEHDSYVDIDPNGTTVRLRVVQKSGGALVGSTAILNNSVVSESICFDPSVHALLPTVTGGAGYKDAGGVALSFTPESIPLIRGNHIRGYVHLVPAGSAWPNISHVSPANTVPVIDTAPLKFTIFNHFITPTYNSTSAETTTLYARNMGDGTLIPLGTFSTPLATGASVMTPGGGLGQGSYQWMFHQKLNGVSNVEVSNTPTEFVGFPVSSLSEKQSFLLDFTKPTAGADIIDVVRAPDDATVTVTARGYGTDSTAGLASSTVKMWDSGGNLIFSQSVVFSAPLPTGQKIMNVEGVVLTAGETYTVIYTNMDGAGNMNTASYTYKVALAPLVSLRPHDVLNADSVRLNAMVDRDGTSAITDSKLCYRTTNTDIISLGNCTSYGAVTPGDVFSRALNALPAGIYYYQAWAKNAENLSAVSGVQSFLIGQPVPGSCAGGRRCVGVPPTTSQISFCAVGNSYQTGYEMRICKGEDNPCVPEDYSSVLSGQWWNVPDADKGSWYQVYARLQYSDGAGGFVWSEWTHLSEIQSLLCAEPLPPTPVAPSISSPTWGSLQVVTPGVWQATLGANVTSNGNSILVWRGFCWGTVSDNLDTCITDGGTGTGAFSLIAGGLPEQRIYFQAGAQNAVGNASTSVSSFVPGATAPTLDTPQYSNVRLNAVSILGNVLTDGGASPINYRVIDICANTNIECDFSSYYRCEQWPDINVNAPNSFSKATCCYSNTCVPITVITTFRVRTCARNSNLLWGCTYNTFQVDPDLVGSEGGGGSTFKPQ